MDPIGSMGDPGDAGIPPLRTRGGDWHTRRTIEADATDKDVYYRYMTNGETARELARDLMVTEQRIRQRIQRYALRHGLPARRQ